MKEKLTEKDRIAYTAIEKYIQVNGYPPSIRELCRMIGKASPATICYRLKSLEQKGYLKTTRGENRTIRIVKAIDGTPVDVAEVVRCKNCKKEWCYLRQELGEDGFCSAGERKTVTEVTDKY